MSCFGWYITYIDSESDDDDDDDDERKLSSKASRNSFDWKIR